MSRHIAARAGALTLALFAFLGADLRAQAGADQVARASSRIPSTGTRWLVDPAHSQVDFRVSHLVGRVRGTFDDWFGVIVTQDDDWTRGTVNVTVQTRSVNTGNVNRDADLRSDRFFAADSFPRLTFESTGIVATDSTVEIGGILTIKGHSRHVVLTGQYRGTAKDYTGQKRIAFDATTVVNRRDFGLEYAETVNGVPGIGDQVEITIAIEAIRVN
jgi:polyisoprenoid-binding protein YceI